MYQLFFDRDKLYLYPWYFADEVLTHDIKKIFGRKINQIILEFKNSHIYYYGKVKEFNAIGKFLLEKVKTDHNFYKLVRKNILETGKELIKFCQQIKKNDLEKTSNKDLINLYLTYAKKIKKMRSWGWVPPLIDGAVTYFLSDYLQMEFKNFMKKAGKDKQTARYFSILSSSEKISEVQKEELARLQLIKELNKKYKTLIKTLKEQSAELSIKKIEKECPGFYKKIKNHAQKFAWLPYAYIGPPLNEKEVAKLIKSSLSEGKTIDQQIKEIEKHYKNLPIKKTKIIKKIKLNDDLKYLFKVYSSFMYLKDLRKGIYQKSYVAMDPLIQEISKRINLSFKEAKYLTAKEIKKALLDGINFKSLAKQRTKYCMVLIENGQTTFLNKNQVKNIKKQIFKNKIKEKDILKLKGTTAFSGKRRGIVKIIATTADIPKINKGEILISPATNPDLIRAMKKASAFVTDTGGITCHAAIVSREMKKPCIVGTKIATKILKDGDLIEVDADKGVVKILKATK